VTTPRTTPQASPDRWAKFIDEHAPGLTWLAATILEWAELPPFARRAWGVTVSTTRAGDVSALAAVHEETGLLVVASVPGAPPPFLGNPDRVKRILGTPEAIETIFQGEPMLAVRRLPGFTREVILFDGEAPRHPLLRRARDEEWETLERFRAESDVDPDPATLRELAGPVQRGLVWVLEGDTGIVGMFRVEGVSRRRAQLADLCVHPSLRGRGHGAALLRAAAHATRAEYARGAVLAASVSDAGVRAAERAGWTRLGPLDDVRLA
jgi:ribosomal protein S18 acetylase RimI-like enzyme